jgi:hypothetical protein
MKMNERTWVTGEVKIALTDGYKITKIYSIWHWDQSEQYYEETKKGGLFTEYVNTFLEIKQENFFRYCLLVVIVNKLI